MPSNSPRSGSDLLFVYILLIASISLNVYLGMRLRTVSASVPRAVLAGAVVPEMAVRSLEGSETSIRFDQSNSPTVLYVFTPPCKWCDRNMKSILTLAAQKGDEYRFVGVSLSPDKLEAYIAGNGIRFPVYTTPDPDTVAAYYLGATPQTIVVDNQNRVVRNWVGAYQGSTKSEVESFFDVTLPELPVDAPPPVEQKEEPKKTLCKDPDGRDYSPGYVTTIAGEKRRCETDGQWKVVR